MLLIFVAMAKQGDPLSLNETKYWNNEYRNAMISMHAGRPAMGQRVTDIISLVDFARSDKMLKGRKVFITANGSYGPAAIHATFLDNRIESAEITRSIKSFNEYITNPMQRDVYTNVLYGVLKYYDLKDLAELSGRNRIRGSGLSCYPDDFLTWDSLLITILRLVVRINLFTHGKNDPLRPFLSDPVCLFRANAC